MTYTVEQVTALIEAMDQLLGDMALYGLCVCPHSKALARVAFEPFLDKGSAEFIMPLERAQQIIREVGRMTRPATRHECDRDCGRAPGSCSDCPYIIRPTK